MAGSAVIGTNLSSVRNLSNRYSATPTIYVDNQNIVNDLFVKPEVPVSNSDVYHVVEVSQENRLDIIAQQYYGDPQLWWVIAAGNDMVDPFVLIPGSTIRIPSMSVYYTSNL